GACGAGGWAAGGGRELRAGEGALPRRAPGRGDPPLQEAAATRADGVQPLAPRGTAWPRGRVGRWRDGVRTRTGPLLPQVPQPAVGKGVDPVRARLRVEAAEQLGGVVPDAGLRPDRRQAVDEDAHGVVPLSLPTRGPAPRPAGPAPSILTTANRAAIPAPRPAGTSRVASPPAAARPGPAPAPPRRRASPACRGRAPPAAPATRRCRPARTARTPGRSPARSTGSAPIPCGTIPCRVGSRARAPGSPAPGSS